MKEYGYIIRRGKIDVLIKQLNDFVALGCNQVFIEPDVSLVHQGTEFRKMYQLLKPEDVVVIPKLSMISNSDVELHWFADQLEKKNITLRILKCDKTSEMNVLKSSKLTIITDKVEPKKSAFLAKQQGRPAIDECLVKEIINYRVYKKLTYRQISELTNLSLGTVYKYIKKYEKVK